jgi:hypothetical protein
MLLQTNSYVVPKEKRAEHIRLLNRFRQIMLRFGCEQFEVFEQAGTDWGAGESSGRYVQLIRFRDRKHHQQVQAVEKTDPGAQKVIAEFCELINFPYQQQQGLFAVGFYNSVLPVGPGRPPEANRSLAHAPVQGHAVDSSQASEEIHEPAETRRTEDGVEIVEAAGPVTDTEFALNDEETGGQPDHIADDPADVSHAPVDADNDETSINNLNSSDDPDEARR